MAFTDVMKSLSAVARTLCNGLTGQTDLGLILERTGQKDQADQLFKRAAALGHQEAAKRSVSRQAQTRKFF